MPRLTPRLMPPLLCLMVSAAAGAGCNAPATERVSVAEVYPTADELPENLLRLYVYFTAPMERTDPGALVSLRDEQGEAVPGALLSTRFGLWSADGRRLTVLLDPGRVKTGLDSHDRLGPVLERGRRYALRIERELQDAEGCALAQRYEKRFRAGPADRSPPEPIDWSLQLPRVKTRDALTVQLQGHTDHLSLAYRIRVLDAQEQVVPGAIVLANHEQVWRFAPAQTWLPGTYTLRIDPTLEDLAGNRPTGLFDDPTSANRELSARGVPVDRPFVLFE